MNVISETTLAPFLARAEEVYYDLHFSLVSQWKAENPGRKAVGFLPLCVPCELIAAAGALPVHVMGGGDSLEIIKGDAYYQSYICHLPRSVVELGLSGRLDALDGLLFPSTCDVIRNLSGMWKCLFPDRYVRYIDLPQNFDPTLGGRFYRHELLELKRGLEKLTGSAITDAALRTSIARYNENRAAMHDLYRMRRERPWLAPTWECYLVMRLGCVLPVEEHTAKVREYLAMAEASGRPERDNARVIVQGFFCEQPPLGLLKTLAQAGCDVVDDDAVIFNRYHKQPVSTEGDPIDALVQAFLFDGPETAPRYIGNGKRGDDLLRRVREYHAEGVVFAAPSFCDPALLDEPMQAAALTEAGVPFTAFKYSEDSGQFAVIREQAGTFADSIKLWGEGA